MYKHLCKSDASVVPRVGPAQYGYCTFRFWITVQCTVPVSFEDTFDSRTHGDGESASSKILASCSVVLAARTTSTENLSGKKVLQCLSTIVVLLKAGTNNDCSEILLSFFIIGRRLTK